MDESEKAVVKFKHLPEDFIVEERGKDRVCKVSPSVEAFENARVDFGKLDVHDRRTFLTCDLEKLNIDHLRALEILGETLRMRAHEIGTAGTKDKRAWTCQRISLYDSDMELIRTFSHPGIILKEFRWAKHKIQIGHLEGNRFTVVLRDAGKEALKMLEKVRRAHIVPNAFGPQRFGSLRKDNVTIGKCIYRKRFEEAVLTLLTGCGEGEGEEVRKAKKRFKEEKNIAEAQKYFPVHLVMEHRMLDHLIRSPKDWIGALKTMDERTLLLIGQSVQSRIFNEIVTRAIEAKIDPHLEVMLPGTLSKFSEGKLGRIEAEVMEEEQLRFSDFHVPQLPFLTLKGSKRKAFSEIQNLEVRTEEDDLFPLSKKILLTFELDSGSYATTFLEEFFVLK